ncbi:MAG: L7Ae/L30e/S12e/Gadd45 family ribosomal protein [Acetanaerobacterium sp.]
MNSDNERLLSMIGMSKRAGKLVAGFDTVTEGVRTGSIACVFYASDVSPKTIKELAYICNQENAATVPVPVTMDEIKRITARRAGIFAVTDAGLRRKINEMTRSDGGKI